MGDRSRGRVPTPFVIALGVGWAGLLGLAINAASNDPSYPRPLRLIQQHPWLAVAILMAGAGLLAVWERRRTSNESLGSNPIQWFRSYQTLPSERQVRARQKLLGEVRRVWIDGILSRSLDYEVPIVLDLAERPGMVIDPWSRLLLHQPGQPDQPLPPHTSIDVVAERFGGSLLILGGPGAGKTTTLLQHARHLLDHADVDEKAYSPVVFHLSSWPARKPPLADWLVNELRLRYGISEDLARHWIDQNALALLLDGLDEVTEARRDDCVSAINAFREKHGEAPLVVCSRIRDYEDLADRLKLSGAVAIQPLTKERVDVWLKAAGRQLEGLYAALQSDGQLKELLTTPLMVHIAALAYRDLPASDIQTYGNLQQRHEHLFNRYVDVMLSRPRSPLAPKQERMYTHEDTVRWLTRLAQQMRRHNESVFYPRLLTASWLPESIRVVLMAAAFSFAVGLATGLGFGLPGALGMGLAGGLVISATVWLLRKCEKREVGELLIGLITVLLVGGVLFGLLDNWVAGLFIGLLAGLVGGMAMGLFARWSPHPIGYLWRRARLDLLFPLLTLPVLGASVGILGYFIVSSLDGIGSELIVSCTFGLLIGFIAHANWTTVMKVAGDPRAHRSLRGFAQSFGISLGLIIGLLYGLTGGPLGEAHLELLILPLIGLVVGIPVGLFRGAANSPNRLVHGLLQHEGLLPAHLISFLDYADSRILLRKAGDGYLFIHRLLQEHFAERDLPVRR